MVLVIFDRGIIVMAKQTEKKPTTEIYVHSRVPRSFFHVLFLDYTKSDRLVGFIRSLMFMGSKACESDAE